MNCVLHPAANGHLALDLNDTAHEGWILLTTQLERDLGAQRFGRVALGLRDRTHQSFRFADFTLSAGWDSWVGNYLLSQCEQGDAFLRRLFLKLRFGTADSQLQSALEQLGGSVGEVRGMPGVDLRHDPVCQTAAPLLREGE